MTGVRRLVTLSVETVQATGRGATISGDVWLGPVAVGDRFTEVGRWDHAQAVNLRLEEVTAPPDAQKVGRTLRVTAVVTGDGLERLHSGAVLLGEVERT